MGHHARHECPRRHSLEQCPDHRGSCGPSRLLVSLVRGWTAMPDSRLRPTSPCSSITVLIHHCVLPIHPSRRHLWGRAGHQHGLMPANWFAQDVLWLEPKGDAPFRSLPESVHREFPNYPPFGDQFEDVVPHLTIAARCPLPQMQSAEHGVDKHLPINRMATQVSLLVSAMPAAAELTAARPRWAPSRCELDGRPRQQDLADPGSDHGEVILARGNGAAGMAPREWRRGNGAAGMAPRGWHRGVGTAGLAPRGWHAVRGGRSAAPHCV
jgi:hypothetical protein